MRKLVIGLVVVAVVVGGAVAGGLFFIQRTAEREVDVHLDNWRANVGPASRGSVSYNLWTRTVDVADVSLQSKISPADKVTIARVVASGVGTRTAGRIEITNWASTSGLPGLAAGEVTQKLPKIVVEDYVGPAVPPRPVEVKSAADLMRVWLEQFAAISAKSITIPSLYMTVSLPSPGARSPAVTEYGYTNIEMRDVRDGKVAHVTADRVVLQGGPPNHPFGRMTGEIGKMSMTDFDVAPLLAFLDPSRVKDDNYMRAYRHISVGPYSLKFENGAGMSVDGFAAEDIGFRPSRLSLNDLMFLSEVTSTGAPPSPVQAQMLLDKVAAIYESMRIGKVQVDGIAFDMLPNAFRIGSVALDGLDNGRLGAFTMESLDGKMPTKEPIKVGRFALKGFDIAGMFRVLIGATGGGRPPSGDQLAGLMKVLEGIEIDQVSVPDPRTGRQIQIDSFGASWGQFIGVVPSKARLTSKITTPVSVTDPEPLKSLADSGIFTLASSMDIGLAWSEDTRAVTLAPATIDIGKLFAFSAKASLGNVPRDVFSTDVNQMFGAALGVEVGAIELSLRDQGGFELAAAQFAKGLGQPPEAGRAMLEAMLAQNAQAMPQADPEMQAVYDALLRFARSNGETLTITLTPKGRVPLMQLIETVRMPGGASVLMGSFAIQARVGR
jgi:hypothetical protein